MSQNNIFWIIKFVEILSDFGPKISHKNNQNLAQKLPNFYFKNAQKNGILTEIRTPIFVLILLGYEFVKMCLLNLS